MRYIPHTEADIREMLRAAGADQVERLFDGIPKDLQLGRALNLPPAMGEEEIRAELSRLGAATDAGAGMISFLGAGLYRHYVPSAVSQLLLRGEFFTAYTPYQPEVAQGTLQVIFEYQSMIAGLLGLEIANASLYDGSTAMAEAALMARRVKKDRPEIVVSGGAHPQYLEVLDTFLAGMDERAVVVPVDSQSGLTSLEAVRKAISGKTAAVIVQSPNFLGCIEDVKGLAAAARDAGALLIQVVTEPLSLPLLKSPGSLGADIAVGEAGGMGIPIQLGGPLCGMFATRMEFLRQIPGRLVGRTADVDGEPGFVITLATREQHIRREKATSNICTNSGLMMLAATIYMTLMGPAGMRETARRCAARARALSGEIGRLKGWALRYPTPFFDEFTVKTPVPAREIIAAGAAQGLVAGLDLGRFDPARENELLLYTSELTTRAGMDRLLSLFRQF
ncbi:MAG: putative glycine dehydrogenase (decarboxylating) subunit 1 [Myxococcota bacterium]|nr:putative glycine dehydrogenase (decarboxylating) subunit 1 [Myxococcota bacterium]